MISIIRSKQLRSRFAVALALTAAILLPLVANAQKYEVDMKNSGAAVVIEQPQPGYPGGSVRRGQEGWVKMSFVVTADGRAIDPIIIDSGGGAGFEREAREAVSTWRFEATTSSAELPYVVINIRSEIRRGRNAATRDFIRRYRRIMTHLYNEKNEHARKMADSTYDLGGWNLYESTMLWLMLGRVEGVEGNHAGKLEMYRRALGVGNSKSLPRKDRRELLRNIFMLEANFGQYAAAMQSRGRQASGPDCRCGEQLSGRLDSHYRLLVPCRGILNASKSDQYLRDQLSPPTALRPASDIIQLVGPE